MRGKIPQAVIEVQAEWEVETARLREQLKVAVGALENVVNTKGLSETYGYFCWETCQQALAQIKDLEK